MLIVMSGLPGAGKTVISRALAEATGAIHLRIDSIEQALRNHGIQVEGEGYAVAHAVAADNLALGRTVIADHGASRFVPGARHTECAEWASPWRNPPHRTRSAP